MIDLLTVAQARRQPYYICYYATECLLAIITFIKDGADTGYLFIFMMLYYAIMYI